MKDIHFVGTTLRDGQLSPPMEYATGKSSLLMLIEQLTTRNNSWQIYVRHENLTVRLEKKKRNSNCLIQQNSLLA